MEIIMPLLTIVCKIRRAEAIGVRAVLGTEVERWVVERNCRTWRGSGNRVSL